MSLPVLGLFANDVLYGWCVLRFGIHTFYDNGCEPVCQGGGLRGGALGGWALRFFTPLRCVQNDSGGIRLRSE